MQILVKGAARRGSAPTRQALPLTEALIALCALAWAYLWRMEWGMPGVVQAVYRMRWSPAFAVMVFAMWVTMMAAMMIPSALPMLRLVARLQRPRESVLLPRGARFASDYLLIWSDFAGVLGCWPAAFSCPSSAARRAP